MLVFKCVSILQIISGVSLLWTISWLLRACVEVLAGEHSYSYILDGRSLPLLAKVILYGWATERAASGGGGRDAHGAVREEGDTHLSQPDQANLPWRSVGWHIPARSPSHPSVDSFNKDKLAHFVNSHLPNSKSHFILCFLHCKIYSIHILLYLSQIYFPLGCDFK